MKPLRRLAVVIASLFTLAQPLAARAGEAHEEVALHQEVVAGRRARLRSRFILDAPPGSTLTRGERLRGGAVGAAVASAVIVSALVIARRRLSRAAPDEEAGDSSIKHER